MILLRVILASIFFMFVNSAISLQKASTQISWPDLKDATSYTFASNRLVFPCGAPVVTTNPSVLSQIYQVSPAYAMSNIRFLFVNFYVDVTGASNPERCAGNSMTVDFATVFIAGKAYPLTFNQAQSAGVADCSFVWSDPMQNAAGALMTLAPSTTYYIRSSHSVGSGQHLVSGGISNNAQQSHYNNTVLGEGVEYTSSPQLAKRMSGTVAAFLNGSGQAGPAMAIGTGWDGSPVFLIVGDSIGSGISDFDIRTGTRGVAGYVERALDDSTFSKRMNYGMFTVPGTRPVDQSSSASGQYGLRLAALQSIPNKPFNRFFSEMGQNGLLSGPATNNQSVPLVQHEKDMKNWWSFLSSICSSCAIDQSTYMPHDSQTSGYFWTDGSHQSTTGATDSYPNGIRWQAINWLKSGTDLPSNVKVFDVTTAVIDPSTGFWKPIGGSWTLNAAVSAAATTLTLSGSSAPTQGDWYVLEPGTANAETLEVSTVTGSGPWTALIMGSAAKAHAFGLTVARASTGDGVHPGSTVHKTIAQTLIGFKKNGSLN